MNTHVRLALGAAVLALVAGCGSCSKDADPTKTGKLGLPKDKAGLALSPLPEPPKLDLQTQPLPGADGALAVVASRPQGKARGEVRPTVTFNKPVKSLEQVEAQRAADQAAPVATLEPAVPGEWRWLGSASLEFVPSVPVPLSTEFKVTVKKGLRALDGAVLAEDHLFTFSTPALELLAHQPAQNFAWLRPDQTPTLLFNQPVDEASLTAGAWFDVNGQKVPLQVMDRVTLADEKKKAREAARAAVGAAPRGDWEEEEFPGFQNRAVRYTVAPQKPFPLGASVQLAFDVTVLKAKEGNLPPEAPPRLLWRTYGPLKLRSARFCQGSWRCPRGPLVLYTSNEVDPASLRATLKVEPPVELDWEQARAWASDGRWEDRSEPWVEVPGKWKPGTQYKVSVAAGTADVFKQADAEGLQVTLQTADLASSLQLGGGLALVEAKGGTPPRVPVEVSNLKTLSVQAWKLTPAELVRAALRDPYEQKPVVDRAPDLREEQALKYAKNAARVHPVELQKLFGGQSTGIALVAVNSPELEHPPKDGYRQVVQVTDLALHLKLGPRSSLGFVTRLSTGEPVEGADVTLYDATGAQKWSGKTGSSGFAPIPGTAELGVAGGEYQWEAPQVVVTAALGQDLSFTASTWSSGVEAYEFGLEAGWEGERPQPTGFVFADRGIYRPGDTVHLKGVVRWREVGELRLPQAGDVLKVVVNDPRGQELLQTTAKATAYGTFALDVPLPKDAPLGWFNVEASGTTKRGAVELSGGFRVEEYRAPQFKVTVEPKAKALLANDALEAKVLARYLFGGAMGNAKVRWNVTRRSATFQADSSPGFVFGKETWWWDDGAPQESRGFVGSGNGMLDALGEFPVAGGRVEAPAETGQTYVVEAEVEDVNRQTVAGRAEVTVHPAGFYVGLRAPSGFLQAGKEASLDTVVVDTKGARAGGRAVDVTVSRRTWKSVKRKDASGGFVTESEPDEQQVHQCALKSAADAPVACSFKPAEGGFYVVKATTKDDQGRKHSASIGAYALGPGFAAWQRNDTDRIELVPDKSKYDVGDVAKVLVKSPYPKARALVTVEREGVLERRLVDLQGSMEAVEVRITEEMVPNVFVGVLLVRPRVAQGGVESGDDPGRPVARVGLAKLAVEKKSKRLQVTVKADRPRYRPGDEVQVSLEVKDAQGRGQSAEVTLYAVDEAVLSLTAYETPDPITHIFPERPLSVRLGEPLLHLVRKRSYGEKGEEAGGGGGKEGADGLRSNFKTTALWLPALEVKDGVGRASFKLPDNLTTFRLMAVAVTKAERFGSGETTLEVTKPVLALPALPRFARVGDRFEAGVVVHAEAPGDVSVSAEADGLRLDGPAQQAGPVGPGAPKEFRFAFVAEKPGTATLKFRAQKGPDQDGVLGKLPVELPTSVEAVATYGDTEGQVVEGVVPPKDALPDQGGLTVTLASTSLGGFDQGFRQLIEYPYGCLEQQSSRLVPFIALREIAGQFGVKWPGADPKKQAAEDELTQWLRTYLVDALRTSQLGHPDEVIAATVKSIVSLQDPSGAFRYWPDSWCTDSWSSAYATLALWRAKEVGFAVPADALSRAEGFLSKVAGGQCGCERTCPAESRAFAVYVLARMKKPKPSHYGGLYAEREKLSLFGRALLAHAMTVGGGDKKTAQGLLQELLNFAKESPKGVQISEASSTTYATYFQSDTRTTGAVLQTLVALQPDHPYVGKMARHLTSVRQGDGAWRSTQEAAFSLLALTDVLRQKERDVPDFQATVALGGKELAARAFKGRSMRVETHALTMAELQAAAAGQDGKLTFKKDGKGVLYYSALLRYAPAKAPTTALDAGLFVQRWFEPYSGGGQATKFNAGDLVRVRVRVASNQERHWLALEVPLPAGLEAVDTTLATTARGTSSPDDEGSGEGYEPDSADAQEDVPPWAFGFWSPFNHVERRDSRLVAFADHLPAGVHVYSFVARATTPGAFVLKPARGALMYEPEVWGRSEGGTFEVLVPTPVSAK